jgi:hypothetical protein
MGVRALILVATLAGPAHAEQRTPTWEFGVALAGGAESIGDQTFAQIGSQFHLARRIVPDLGIALRAELLNTNASRGNDTIIGETGRLLAGLDWRVYHSPRGFPIPELFVIGGVGTELVAWDRGIVHRMLTYTGFEARQNGRVRTGSFRGVTHVGMRYGVRLQVARDVEAMTLARACTLCDVPDRGRGFDAAVIGYYGLDFGR